MREEIEKQKFSEAIKANGELTRALKSAMQSKPEPAAQLQPGDVVDAAGKIGLILRAHSGSIKTALVTLANGEIGEYSFGLLELLYRKPE